MKILSSNKSLILILLFLSSSLFSEDTSNYATYDKKTYDQGYGLSENQMMESYNQSARVNTNGKYDFFVDGSFIYWQAREKGLDIVQTPTTPIDITNNPVRVIQLDFDYNAGFKVGIGMHTPSDNWTAYLDYTRLNADSTSSRNDDVSFSSVWIAATNLNILSLKWELDYNIIELSLLRTNLTGKYLDFSPFVSFFGGWIEQKINADASTANATTYLAKAAADSWVVGPKVGINTKWKFTDSFGMTNGISAGLAYQDFTNVSFSSLNVDTQMYLRFGGSNLDVTRLKMENNYLMPNLNLNIGLFYGTYLGNNGYHLEFMAKYEFLHFWNQNQMRYLLNVINFVRTQPGSLMMHGLTAMLRFEF